MRGAKSDNSIVHIVLRFMSESTGIQGKETYNQTGKIRKYS